MSLLSLDETAGDLPVRDTNQKASVITAIRDVSSSTTLPIKSHGLKTWTKGSRSLARTRRQINRVSRTELEDGFLRLHDENLLLKEFARKQEDRIKRMGTRLQRLSHERMQSDGRPDSWVRASSRNLDLEEELEGIQERVRELERRNDNLRSRLLFYKQQLQLQGCGRHCPYGYVTPRVNTGLRRAQTAGGRAPDRLRRGIRVQGPAVRPTHTAPPSYGELVLEAPQVEMEKLTHSLILAELGPDPEPWSSTLDRERAPEISRSQHLHLEVQERRANIRNNLESIRLKKLLQVKNSELVTIKAQFNGLQEAYETQLQQNQEALRSASEALLAQVEELNVLLREETQKTAALENQLETLSPLQAMLKDFQERVGDLETERDLLKADYDKLLQSCINTAQQNLGELPQKDTCPIPEGWLTPLMVEKKSLEEQLEKERARNEELKREMSQRMLIPVQEVNPSQEKATILEDQTRVENPQSGLIQPLCVDILEREAETEEASFRESLKRKLHETEAAHAETVLELEKTRDMLILQHRINRDYQAELEGVMLQVSREKKDHEEKEQQMARVLDLRGTRIRQLEEQLKDVAYGTKVVPFCLVQGDPSMGADLGQAPKLRHGENLFELHISGVVLSAEALCLLGDLEPVTFCTYSFYDFETHCTPMARGVRPRYSFTSQYVVQVEPLFLQYLRGATSHLELHLASGTDHTTLASGWLRFGEALASGQQVHATAVLQGPNGEDYGLLEYWVQLRFPIDQTLMLHHQRSKALSYLSAGVPRSILAQENWPQQRDEGRGSGWNELRIQIEGCAGLLSRWLGTQPSPYAIYKFFTFPDHDTVIIPSSNNPHFGDLQSFALHVTPELHHYLLLQSLGVYVFDDEDEEPSSYLGKAQISLVPLAQGRNITGDFILMDPMGKPNGSIRLSLEWKRLYMPPEEGRLEALMEQKQETKEEQVMRKSQVLRETSASPLPSSQQRKKPRLYPPKAEKHVQKHRKPEKGLGPLPAQGTPTVECVEDITKEDVEGTVALEELREEVEERPAAGEEDVMVAGSRRSDSVSSAVAEIVSEEPDSTSEAQTTESDEVVVGTAEIPDPQHLPSNSIRIEIISLWLHPDSQPVADDHIQQLYVEYRFPGVPLEETETPFSLRKPRGGQEIYFHFSKVIHLDPDLDGFQRRQLFSMLKAEEPEQNRLQFIVVSEPMPGAEGECEDVGFAYLDLREILLTGCDAYKRDLQVLSSFDPDINIGVLKVSTEVVTALRAVYYAGKKKNGKDG